MKVIFRNIQIWQEAPFIRLLAPLILGILFAQLIEPLAVYTRLMAVASLLILLVLGQFLSIKKQFRLLVIQGSILQLIILLFGLTCMWQQQYYRQANYYGKYISNGKQQLIVQLLDNPLEKQKCYTVRADVLQINQKQCIGELQINLAKGEWVKKLKYGTIVKLNTTMQPIRNTGNPGCFDYETYSQLHNCTYSTYCAAAAVTLLKQAPNPIKAFLFYCRDGCIEQLKRTIPGALEAGVCEALLIGYKADLENSLQLAYSNTGIVHILAISGMHLGLIFILLNKLFFFLTKNKWQRAIKAIVILGLMWGFSIITGASGSVVRAAVMFTFIIGGQVLERNSSIYNMLAGSAFTILVFSPATLWDVGFQLSYIAVIGIIWLQRPINGWFYFKDKIRTAIWSTMAVSLAAQLMAFPICLYYFHQFPNYFLLANLIAIPLSTVLLYAELALLVTLPLPVVAHWIGIAIHWLTYIMNSAVLFINQLPGALSDSISFSAYDCLLLYLFLFLSINALLYKNTKQLRWSLLVLVLLSTTIQWEEFIANKQNVVLVYNLQKQSYVEFISGTQVYKLADSTFATQALVQTLHIKPSHVAMRINQLTPLNQDKGIGNMIYCFRKQTFLLLTKSLPSINRINEFVPCDYVILTNNITVDFHALISRCKPQLVVIDNSFSTSKRKKWIQMAQQLHCKVWDIATAGAFKLNL